MNGLVAHRPFSFERYCPYLTVDVCQYGTILFAKECEKCYCAHGLAKGDQRSSMHAPKWISDLFGLLKKKVERTKGS